MRILTIEEEAERLRARFSGVNRAEFARDHGLKGGQSMIYQNITGRRPISMDAAKAYASGFGCSLEDISPRLALEASGAAKHLAVSSRESVLDPNVLAAPLGSRRIPLVNYVQAGAMREIGDQAWSGEAAEYLQTDLELGSTAFALEIRGTSMLPEFREGDRVIIDPEVQPQPGDFVVAKNGGEEATFKKYRPRGLNERGDEIFELVPLNEDYPSMRSDVTPLLIIGTMVEHRRYRKR